MKTAKPLQTLVIAALVIFGAFAGAKEDATVESFQTAAASIPQSLMSMGHRNFGRLDLSDLLQKIQTVHVVSVSSIRRAQRVGPTIMERDSAEWDRSSGPFIRVNRTRWSQTAPQIRAVVALHEHLGVAGFDDQNYVLSTSLWLLANPRANRVLNASDFQGVSDRVQMTAQGGITGVGGGGDEFGARLKMMGLERGLSEVERARSADERSSAVQDLYARFYINNEIRRNGAIRYDPSVNRESVTGGYQLCQQILRSSPAEQQTYLNQIHSGGEANVQIQLPDVPALVKFCRQLKRQGLQRMLRELDR